MTLLLAYPNAHIERRPDGASGIRTIDCALGGGWPDTQVGPDCCTDPLRAAQALSIPGVSRILALSEEAVLSVALAGQKAGVPAISREAARCVSSRYALRAALAPLASRRGHRVNPEWQPANEHLEFDGPYVVKAAASSHSRGVELVEHRGAVRGAVERVERRAYLELHRLRDMGYGRPPDSLAIVEAFVEGPQYCLNGIIKNGEVTQLFCPVLQHWTEDRRFIERYTPIEDEQLGVELATYGADVAYQLGLDFCGFNIEVRVTDEGFVVIDAHARLGEDGGGYSTLIDVEGYDANMRLIDEMRRP